MNRLTYPIAIAIAATVWTGTIAAVAIAETSQVRTQAEDTSVCYRAPQWAPLGVWISDYSASGYCTAPATITNTCENIAMSDADYLGCVWALTFDQENWTR